MEIRDLTKAAFDIWDLLDQGWRSCGRWLVEWTVAMTRAEVIWRLVKHRSIPPSGD